MTRRQLLQLPVAAAALRAADAMGAPITKIEAFNAPYKTTAGFRQRERPSVLVKITTEDRSFGWGQSVPLSSRAPETPESVITAIRNYLTPALIGERPGDFPAIHSAMRLALGPDSPPACPSPKPDSTSPFTTCWARPRAKTFHNFGI